MSACRVPHRILFAVCTLLLVILAVSGCSEDCPPCPRDGRILSVRPDGAGRYKTIQDAVDDAWDGDTIELADGRYHGAGNRDIDLLGKAITLRSLSLRADACTIDCQGGGEDPHRAFHFHWGEEPSTRVEHLTILHGYARFDGGGILCEKQSSPTLHELIVSTCVAMDHGGGLCVKGSSSPLVKSCLFESNFGRGGGGVSSTGGSPHILNSTFEGNRGGFAGGLEIWVPGADEPIVEGCSFLENTGGSGGAIFVQLARPTIMDCFSSGNSGNFGGFIFCASGSPIVLRCISLKDTASSHGAILHCQGRCDPHLISCTLTQGYSDSLGPESPGSVVHLHDNSHAFFTRCIVSFGRSSRAVDCSHPMATCTFSCSDVFGNEFGDWTGCIEDQMSVQGNISADPLFCGVARGDLHLKTGSPCGADSSGCGQIGALPVYCE